MATTMRDLMREIVRELLPDGTNTKALCSRVPEVAALRGRIDATDFPTQQECADARHMLVPADPIKTQLFGDL